MPVLFKNIPYFESEKWIARLPRVEDAGDLMDLFEEPLSLSQSERMILHHLHAWNGRQETILACFDKGSHEVKVLIELYQIREDTCAIGYRTRSSQRGKGYGGSAVCFVCHRLLEEGWLHSIHADVDRRNTPSVRILEKTGFRRTGVHSEIMKYRLDHHQDLTKEV